MTNQIKESSSKKNILLFGPPGVGKSTVGEVFRDEFGFSFYDADDEMTSKERSKVSKGKWNDNDRRKLLARIAKRINQLNKESELGLVTSAALTKQWMREFLSSKTDVFLQFVFVTTLISQLELEEKVKARHDSGHPISLTAFRKFTNQFDDPKMPYLDLKNPHNIQDQYFLIEEISRVLELMKRKES